MKMKLYQFMPDELSGIASQVKGNILAQMKEDGDISEDVAEKWSRRGVLVQEAGFLRKLFGELFCKRPKGLRIVIVEHVTEPEDEETHE